MKWLIILLALLSSAGVIQAQDNHLDKKEEKKEKKDKEEKKEKKDKEDKEEKEEKEEKKKDKEKKDKEEKEEKKEEKKLKSSHTFTGSVSFVSDYRFRGISQTMRRPAIQGTLNYSNVNGIYLGTFGSNVDGTTHFYNNTSMEWDFYGGYKGKVPPNVLSDMTYDFGLIYYYYPGGQAKVPARVRYDTGEFYIELAYKWFSVKYWQTLTHYFGVNAYNPPFNWKKNRPACPNGSSRGSIYIEANASFDLYQQIYFSWLCLQAGKLNLFLHVGHEHVRHYRQVSYTDWRITLTQGFAWFNLFVTYVGTNAYSAYFNVPDDAFHPEKRHLGAQGVVVGVIRTF